MTAIIYSAGKGTRLDKLTTSIPKALLQVAGKPLIEYALARAIAFKPQHIIIVVGYQAEAIKRAVGNAYQGRAITYVFNEQYECAGNMTSLWAAREFCAADTIFTTSDMICSRADLEQIAHAPMPNKILIDKNPEYFNDPEPVKVAIKNGYITEVRKRDFSSAVGGAAMGIYCFGAPAMEKLMLQIAHRVRAGTVDASLYYAINELCQNVVTFPVITEGAKWFDIDTPEELAQAEKWVSQNKMLYF